jgi:uncharacterized membrane protein YphA (DoxX/SURF4 family)
MHILTLILRGLLGLVFLVFGLNGFLHFLPMPPQPQAASAFFGALAATGYMLPLIMGTQVIGGALLLAGVGVPFALVILAPVIVNIVAFHLFVAPEGLPLAIVVAALEIALAGLHRGAFVSLFTGAARR